MPAETDFIVLDARIDLKNWDKAVAQMEADAKSIGKDMEKGIPNITANVDVKVDDQKIKRLDSDLQSLKQGVTVDIDATIADALTKLEDVASNLNDLKSLARLQITLEIPNIIENIGGFVQELPIASQLVEMDTALSQLQARTGEMLPEAEHLIQDLYVNAWGESITQIGEVVAAAKNLGVTNENLRVAVEKAFVLESLGIGDATEALRTMDTMVKNNLAPNYAAAADILVTGLQEGTNRGDDLLDTFNEYGSTFKTLGIDGGAALAFINSGLIAGVDNSDRIADALRETGIRLAEMGTNESIKAAFEQLDSLSAIDLSGMWEGFQAGDIDGGEFYTAFFQALEDASTKDPAAAKSVAATLVGTIAEDFGIEAVTQLTGVWDPAWGAIEDRSVKAATAVSDNLGTAISELTRTIETDLVSSLNEALNLDQLVDDAKAAIQRLAAALREGKGLPEALEIALEMPGLADKISQLESVLGNFVIDFMGGIASIGEALGQDMSGIRDTIAGFAGGQLGFDIQTAQTEEEIAAAVQRAITRGASSADISSAIQAGFGEVLSEGDIAKAQDIMNALEALPRQEMGALAIDAGQRAGDDADVAVNLLRKARELKEAQLGLAAATPAGALALKELDDAVAQIESRFVNVDTDTMQTGISMMVADMNSQLKTAVETGDFEGAAAIAKQLLDTENPAVQEQISQFTTDLMFAFDEAMAAGNVGEAQSILDLIGMGEDANTTVFAAMKTQLADFQNTGTYVADEVRVAFGNMGDQMIESSDKSVDSISELWGALTSETGLLGILRLDSLAKRIEAVSDSLKDALEQIDEAEDQVGSGAIDGKRVGGVGHAGVTTIGEGGRELVFADERFAVLNNQTTERLYTALQGMSGASNTTSNSRTVNYSPTIIVQNSAQAALFGGHALDQLRGEAF